MYKDLADFSVGYLQKKGAEYAEARLETNETSRFVLNDGNPESSSFDDYSGIGVRFSIKKNMGFVSINNLDKIKIKNLLDKSFKLTERSSKIADTVDFAESKTKHSRCKVVQKINIEDLGPDKKLSILNDLNKNLDSEHRYFSLSDKLTKKYYVNTEGSKIYSEIPRLNFFYFLTVNESGESIQRYLQYGATGGYELINKWELEKNIESEIKALKDNLRNGVKAPQGNVDVVLLLKLQE